MVESSGKNWRKELLENNTLLSVITFPEDLFYPVSVGTIGVFVKRGVSHDFENQKVYFARATTDGLRKKKGERIKIKNSENKLQEIQEELIEIAQQCALTKEILAEIMVEDFMGKITDKNIQVLIESNKKMINLLKPLYKEVFGKEFCLEDFEDVTEA